MSAFLSVPSSIVSSEWLLENLDHPSLVVLEASIPKVGQNIASIQGGKRIPGTRTFDLKGTFRDKSNPLPNSFPSPETVEEGARELGINNNSCIVIYDVHGIYSAPRAWWILKAMGHKNIAVLNGGLPEWNEKEYPTSNLEVYNGEKGSFTISLNKQTIKNYLEVLNIIDDKSCQIIDARSEGRFNATHPEPRAELRGGHIPGSSNIPIDKIMSQGHFLDRDVIHAILSDAGAGERQLVFSCGSGITACVLALAADYVGYKNMSIYDGSWTEWASNLELPIEV